MYGLNSIKGEAGIEQCVVQASSVFGSLGGSLRTFEIGNEFDGEHPSGFHLEPALTCDSIPSKQDRQLVL